MGLLDLHIGWEAYGNSAGAAKFGAFANQTFLHVHSWLFIFGGFVQEDFFFLSRISCISDHGG